MCDDRFRTIVAEALTQVLETMFFTTVLGPAEGMPPQDLMIARVEFSGQPSGWLSLGITGPAARELAENFLGIDEALDEHQSGEVVRELANMVCGTMLSQVESDTHFELSEPRLVAQASPASLRQTFELENGFVEVSLDTLP